MSKGNAAFLLLLLGIMFVWLGLTGRLGAVLAAIFEPSKLSQGNAADSSSADTGKIPTPEPNNPSFWLPNPFQGMPNLPNPGKIPTPEPNNPSFWLPNPFQGL